MLAWWGVRMPVQLGPMRQPSTLLTMSTICFSSLAPSSFSSLKPAEMMMKARVPFCRASSSTAAGQWAAATARMARSVWGSSLRSLYDFTPWTSSCLGLAT